MYRLDSKKEGSYNLLQLFRFKKMAFQALSAASSHWLIQQVGFGLKPI
jgi:hypothetical protein